MLNLTEEQINSLYLVYSEKLSKGGYIIPPLLIIDEIVRARYKPENLEIKYTASELVRVEKVDDFKNKEVFVHMLESSGKLPETIIEDKRFLYNYHKNYITANTVIIKYPKITITNSKKESHEILDLYINISFDMMGKLRNYFTVCRGTYTYTELLSGYKHSHCNMVDIMESDLKFWSTPCLGSGTLATSLAMLLRITTVEEFDEFSIMSLFSDIDAYVSWESLEGGPYMYMSSLNALNNNSKGLTTFHPLIYLNTKEKIVAKELLEEDNFLSNFTLIPSINELKKPVYKVNYDEYKLVTYITNKIKELGFEQEFFRADKYYYITKDDFNQINYYTLHQRNKVNSVRELEGILLFTFNGEEVRLKIIDDIDAKLKITEKVFTPSLLYFIVEQIENEINTKNYKSKFQLSTI